MSDATPPLHGRRILVTGGATGIGAAAVGVLGGALGDPARDVGPILVFLAGPGSGFITGQLLAVDGGLIMVGG
jgi:NAD(P)-dependent dehydrogenase (short-subunit alcohol dehydrogenase family)